MWESIAMSSTHAKFLELDWGAFDPWRIQPLRHRLIDHPLLQPDQLVALGSRLEVEGRVRTHSDNAEAGTPFNSAPRLHPNRRSAADTLEHINQAKAWMSLLNVQTDAIYRTLVDQVLDEVQQATAEIDPDMSYRGGWIFVTSPNAVTPFHFDKEHNFLVQIRGQKKIYVWDHRDTEAASEAARDRFHARHERDLLVWRDSLRDRAQIFHLQPGQGAYMPSTSPHMVENGDEPSITMSFTYYTRATRRDSHLHRAHYALRRCGIKPAPVGESALLDAVLLGILRGSLSARSLLRRLGGGKVRSDRAAYAFADVY
jgi:hypothetical protein